MPSEISPLGLNDWLCACHPECAARPTQDGHSLAQLLNG